MNEILKEYSVKMQKTVDVVVSDFASVSGLGVSGNVDLENESIPLLLGNKRLMEERQVSFYAVKDLDARLAELSDSGATPLLLAVNGRLVGMLAVADTIRPETAGVVNASCEFDVESLRPTYKLSVGVPGKSNAFLISEKLGIPEPIIEAARQHLSADDKRLDAVLGQLDDLKLQLKASQDEVERLRHEAAHQLEAAQQKKEELIRQGENELEAARAKARALAQQVENEAYRLTDELRQIQKDEKTSAQQRAQRAREIAKKESAKLFAHSDVVHNPVRDFVPLKEVRVGQEVCIAELGQLATVLALPDRNGDVLVRAGIVKTKVPLKGLKQPDKMEKAPAAPKTKAQMRYTRQTGDSTRGDGGHFERVRREAKMECNLLGLTVDEAIQEADSFIDHAVLNGQSTVYLIHGNGTGALRAAIQKHLRGHRNVKSFRLGRYGEGESGVTVVELK